MTNVDLSNERTELETIEVFENIDTGYRVSYPDNVTHKYLLGKKERNKIIRRAGLKKGF